MGKRQTDYSKSAIYAIVCCDETIKDSYVGSTCEIHLRTLQHAQSCCDPRKRDHNAKKYKFIRENGGWGNWNVVVLENYSCSTHEELLQREIYYINKYQPTLNVTYCHGRNFSDNK